MPFGLDNMTAGLIPRFDLVEQLGLGLPRVRRPSTQPLSPEEEASLTSEILGGSMGALQYVGETLDKPGRAFRGLLAGKPEELLNLIPFSDTLGITDPQQSVTGRQLLEDYGVLDANTEGLDAGDVAGFGAEVLLDPTTYMTFGASALTKGGKALKNAGLLGRGALRAGARTGRTVGEVLDALGDAAKQAKGATALQDAAQAAGTTVDALRAEKVGGLMGLGLPFMEPSTILGTGGIGQRLGGMMDAAGETLRHGKIPGTNYSPGQHFAALFDAPALGNTVPELDDTFRGVYDRMEKATADIRGGVARDALARKNAGILDDVAGDALRKQVELGHHSDVRPEAGALLPEIGKRQKKASEKLRQSLTRRGREVPIYKDEAGVEHGFRYMVDETPNGALHSRHDDMMHWQDGTETIKQIARDADILNAQDAAEAGEILKRKYGHLYWGDKLPPIYGEAKNIDYAAPMLANRVRKATPEQRLAGFFGNDPQADFERGMISMTAQDIKDDAFIKQIAKWSKDVRQIDPSEPVVKVGDLIEKFGLKAEVGKNQGALPELMRQMRLPKSELKDKNVRNYVLNRVVPERIANALTGLQQSFGSPDSVNKLVGAWDLATNLFKVSVLSWPATKVRDLASGLAANFLAGAWSPTAMSAAKRLINGKAPEALQKAPELVSMMASRGLQNTPENAADMLSELAYKYQLFSGQQGAGGTGHLGGAASHSMAGRTAELASELPGVVPMNAKSIVTAGDSWNPIKMRAITGSPTRSKWTAVFEEAGRYSDGINRLTAFVDQLMKGVDSSEAAKIANAIQVNYKPESFTRFERTVAKRLIPFWSFHRKVIPEIVKTLMEKPGGRLGQSIRAADQPRKGESYLPDYVSEGAAIPMGDGRYVTGFGLMHESLNDIVGIKPSVTGTVTRTAQKLGSMLNPALKLPIELMSGTNLYTGRPQKELYQYPTDDPLTNMILGNSPLARAIHTTRKMGDERKSLGVKALNLGTGIGVTDLSGGVERAKEFAARRAADELLKESPRIKSFESLYVPDEMEPFLTEREKQLLRLRATSVKRAREAAKKKKEKS